MSRTQLRQSGGQFRRTSLADFGLVVEECHSCRALNPHKPGIEPKPTKCHECGMLLLSEVERLEAEQDKVQGIRDARELAQGSVE